MQNRSSLPYLGKFFLKILSLTLKQHKLFVSLHHYYLFVAEIFDFVLDVTGVVVVEQVIKEIVN